LYFLKILRYFFLTITNQAFFLLLINSFLIYIKINEISGNSIRAEGAIGLGISLQKLTQLQQIRIYIGS